MVLLFIKFGFSVLDMDTQKTVPAILLLFPAAGFKIYLTILLPNAPAPGKASMH